MTTPPFGPTTPLSASPFLSRLPLFTLNTGGSAVNNYPLVAFKPGFPLQAAELNEIQENFAIQQTLSNTLLTNWLRYETSAVLTGSPTDIYTGPGWNGAIPLDPAYVTASPAGVVARMGWYLITLPVSNLKFWVYNDTDFAPNSAGILSAYYFGFSISSEFIPCSNTVTDPGWEFNDQSSGGFESSTCGANRFKININGVLANTSLSSGFVPITRVTSASAGSLLRFINNKLVTRLS